MRAGCAKSFVIAPPRLLSVADACPRERVRFHASRRPNVAQRGTAAPQATLKLCHKHSVALARNHWQLGSGLASSVCRRAARGPLDRRRKGRRTHPVWKSARVRGHTRKDESGKLSHTTFFQNLRPSKLTRGENLAPSPRGIELTVFAGANGLRANGRASVRIRKLSSE